MYMAKTIDSLKVVTSDINFDPELKGETYLIPPKEQLVTGGHYL